MDARSSSGTRRAPTTDMTARLPASSVAAISIGGGRRVGEDERDLRPVDLHLRARRGRPRWLRPRCRRGSAARRCGTGSAGAAKRSAGGVPSTDEVAGRGDPAQRATVRGDRQLIGPVDQRREPDVQHRAVVDDVGESLAVQAHLDRSRDRPRCVTVMSRWASAVGDTTSPSVTPATLGPADTSRNPIQAKPATTTRPRPPRSGGGAGSAGKRGRQPGDVRRDRLPPSSPRRRSDVPPAGPPQSPDVGGRARTGPAKSRRGAASGAARAQGARARQRRLPGHTTGCFAHAVHVGPHPGRGKSQRSPPATFAPMRPTDIAGLVSAASPAVSPDGTRIAFVVARVDEPANRYRSQIWLASTSGGAPPRPLTAGEKGDGSPGVVARRRHAGLRLPPRREGRGDHASTSSRSTARARRPDRRGLEGRGRGAASGPRTGSTWPSPRARSTPGTTRAIRPSSRPAASPGSSPGSTARTGSTTGPGTSTSCPPTGRRRPAT